MLRSNHYDAAFEAYLRDCRTPYVAVDETRRALLADVSLKSMDFIVYAAGGDNLLVDVKGRKRVRGRWSENWATREDIEALLKWQQVFGAGFRSLLVFAYACDGFKEPSSQSSLEFRGRQYEFFGVWVDDYREVMKTRSPRWQTVWVPTQEFRARRFSLQPLLSQSPTI